MRRGQDRLPVALLALAIGGFGIGCSEFTIMGLLPDVAAGVDTSITNAGHLVSAYALGVVIGAPTLVAVGIRVERRNLLIALMCLFTLGNVLAAMAPSYEFLLFSRVLTGLPHGAFFGVGAVVAASLVAPKLRGAAIATMFTGLAVANVVGVPGGTWLGQQLGWAASFWAAAAVGLVAIISIALLIPRIAPEPAGLRGELAVFAQRRVWLALAITTLGFGGVFAVIGYINLLMTREAGFDESAMTPILVVMGLGMVLGTQAAGRLMSRFSAISMVLTLLTVLTATLLAFTFLTPTGAAIPIVTLVFLLGLVSFAVGTPLQTLVIEQSESAPTLASSANQAGFNLGNAIGPAAAGAAIAAGFGYASAGWVGAAITATGLLLALVFLAVRNQDAVGADQARDGRQ